MGVRTALLVLGLIASNLSAASAPDTITGKVYHEFSVLIRAVSDFSIRFDANGRYHFLKNVAGTTVTPDGSLALATVPDDGTYAYVRTGATGATITLSEPGGTLDRVPRFHAFGSSTAATLTLTFTADSSGEGTDGYTFWFSDAATIQIAPVANVSLRGSVAPGKPLIAGLSVPGDPAKFVAARDVLIRVVGPGLGQFGVTGAWADPDFRLYRGPNVAPVGVHSGDWSQAAVAAFQKIFAEVGAFPLPAGSQDAVGLVRLSPGAYTIVAGPAAAADAGGEVLIEVYFLP